MAWMVPDELWAVVAPLLPAPSSHARGGRPRIPDRKAFAGILFILRSGCPWSLLPAALGGGSGSTCWRRLREWHEAGVWPRLERVLLQRLGDADPIDWSRASIDATSGPANRGAQRPGRIRRIAARRARNALWWSVARAFRWPRS